MSRLGPGCAVGVVGAGTMGAGIAQVAALAGHSVLLHDSAPGRAATAVGEITGAIDRLVARGRVDRTAAAEAQNRLTPAATVDDLAGCALVVEAAVEALEAKQAILAAVEGVVDPGCVLATNTSSLSVADVAALLRHPGRCVGMHFFNPAPVMRLVEVVSGAETDAAVADEVARLATAWGKTPVRVASTPGFVVNRVARPFYGEALLALEEQAADAATIDAVLREGGGFRMGPLELTDLIGQDVNLATSRSVWQALGRDPRYAPSSLQEELVRTGRLGRKSGAGFYPHTGDARPGAPATAAPEPRPTTVEVRGDWGPWAPLWDRLSAAGVQVEHTRSADEPAAVLDGGLLVPTDGRTASARGAAGPGPVVVLDLVLDPATATRFTVAPCADCHAALLGQAVGLLQATGAAVTVVADRPGLLVSRTVAMLVDEAADVVDRGVATAADVDTAMRLGAGYPVGPLEWGDRIGATRVADVLDHVRAATNAERYRVSSALRRAATTGRSLRDR